MNRSITITLVALSLCVAGTARAAGPLTADLELEAPVLRALSTSASPDEVSGAVDAAVEEPGGYDDVAPRVFRGALGTVVGAAGGGLIWSLRTATCSSLALASMFADAATGDLEEDYPKCDHRFGPFQGLATWTLVYATGAALGGEGNGWLAGVGVLAGGLVMMSVPPSLLTFVVPAAMGAILYEVSGTGDRDESDSADVQVSVSPLDGGGAVSVAGRF